jgi:carboxymethylenebutenolidase
VAEHVQLEDGTHAQLFEPGGRPETPAVVILHERYGLVQHTLDLAGKLANGGYVALAPDLFSHWSGDREALRRGDVRVTLSDPQVAGTIERCLSFLEPRKVALMGVCQSGRYPIVAAARRPDVAACVVFYGAASDKDWEVNQDQPRPMPDLFADMRAPSLWVFGEADHTISLGDVRRVRDSLEAARRGYRMRVFADMPHGWLNDTMPGRYRPAEAEQAWSLLLEFLAEVFEGRWPRHVVWEFRSDSSPDYDFSRNVRLA